MRRLQHVARAARVDVEHLLRPARVERVDVRRVQDGVAAVSRRPIESVSVMSPTTWSTSPMPCGAIAGPIRSGAADQQPHLVTGVGDRLHRVGAEKPVPPVMATRISAAPRSPGPRRRAARVPGCAEPLVVLDLQVRELHPGARQVERVGVRREAAVGLDEVAADLLRVLDRLGRVAAARARGSPRRSPGPVGLPEDLWVAVGAAGPNFSSMHLVDGRVHVASRTAGTGPRARRRCRRSSAARRGPAASASSATAPAWCCARGSRGRGGPSPGRGARRAGIIGAPWTQPPRRSASPISMRFCIRKYASWSVRTVAEAARCGAGVSGVAKPPRARARPPIGW